MGRIVAWAAANGSECTGTSVSLVADARLPRALGIRGLGIQV